MRRNVIDRLRSHKPRLAICSKTFGEYYEAMKYYTVVYILDTFDERTVGYSNGFFILNNFGKYDFFPIDEFKSFFTIVEGCGNEKINKYLSFLRNQLKFDIKIQPIIECDGYFYRYKLEIRFPFTMDNILEDTFASYIEAAKRAINIARKACLRKHAKDGIFFWLNYAKVKKG